MNLVEKYIHENAVIDLDELVNQKKVFKFYGACNNEFKVDNFIWEAIEDPDDGYRSYLKTVNRKRSTGIFYRDPIAQVTIESIEIERSFVGYYIVDVEDKHIWLKIGTDYTDDYYPYFVFEYQPKESKYSQKVLFPDQQEKYLN